MLFTFTVTFWEDDSKSMKTSYGFWTTNTLTDAFEKITQWYGEENIDDIKISCFGEEGSIYEFKNSKEMDDFIKNLEGRLL